MRYLALLLILTGCTAMYSEWTHPTASEEQQKQDRYECLRAASNPPYIQESIFASCMEARGYTER